MNVAFALGWIVAAALVLVGLFALLAPARLGRGYGVRAEDRGSAGFARATGIRDVALGLALGATAYFHDLPLLIVFAIAGIAVSVADFFIAYHHGHERRLHASHGIHAAGAVAFVLVLAMALFALGR